MSGSAAPSAAVKSSKATCSSSAVENPDDVRMRWIAMGEEASFDVDMIPVHFMPGIFDVAAQWQQIEKKATALGGVVFVAVDTAPAYFTGDDENSNTQIGAHARKLRTLTTLPGRPTVIANCHPTKSANSDSLVPRGGGAFLGEVDGNLTSVREDRLVRLHWAGKIRGPDFEAVPVRAGHDPHPAARRQQGSPAPDRHGAAVDGDRGKQPRRRGAQGRGRHPGRDEG